MYIYYNVIQFRVLRSNTWGVMQIHHGRKHTHVHTKTMTSTRTAFCKNAALINKCVHKMIYFNFMMLVNYCNYSPKLNINRPIVFHLTEIWLNIW